jgi:hypothetical protein
VIDVAISLFNGIDGATSIWWMLLMANFGRLCALLGSLDHFGSEH